MALTGRSCRTRDRARDDRLRRAVWPGSRSSSSATPARSSTVPLVARPRTASAATCSTAPRRAGARPSCARRSPSSCPTGWRWSRARRPRAAPTSTGCVAALWPARAEAAAALRRGRSPSATRCSAGSARGARPGGSLDAWDRELAAAGLAADRRRAREAVELLADRAVRGGRRPSSGSPGSAALRVPAALGELDAEGSRPSCAERREARRRARLHRPRPAPATSSRSRSAAASLRRYGSQGEQRLGLLALLFAEREALPRARRQPPLLLLDDVMSELDPDRREPLVGAAARAAGQALITATEPRSPAGDRGDGAGDRGRRRGRERGGGGVSGRRRGRRPADAAQARVGAARGSSRERGAADAARGGPGGLARRRRARRSPPGRAGRGARRGVTIACRSATWAQELDLIQAELLEGPDRRRDRGRAT